MGLGLGLELGLGFVLVLVLGLGFWLGLGLGLGSELRGLVVWLVWLLGFLFVVGFVSFSLCLFLLLLVSHGWL